MALRARCHHCHAAISARYPLVEALTAIAAAAALIYFGTTPTAAVVFILLATLIVVSFIDYDFKIIPNVISFPGITIGCCISILAQFYPHLFAAPITQGTRDSLIGILGGSGFFYVIGLFYYALTKREGLGGGDIKLMALTGAVLGGSSVVPIIFAGSFFGAAIGVLIIALKGGGRHTEIPFGPWLSLGAVLYLFVDLPFFHLF